MFFLLSYNLNGCSKPPTLFKASSITSIKNLKISYHFKCHGTFQAFTKLALLEIFSWKCSQGMRLEQPQAFCLSVTEHVGSDVMQPLPQQTTSIDQLPDWVSHLAAWESISNIIQWHNKGVHVLMDFPLFESRMNAKIWHIFIKTQHHSVSRTLHSQPSNMDLQTIMNVMALLVKSQLSLNTTKTIPRRGLHHDRCETTALLLGGDWRIKCAIKCNSCAVQGNATKCLEPVKHPLLNYEPTKKWFISCRFSCYLLNKKLPGTCESNP